MTLYLILMAIFWSLIALIGIAEKAMGYPGIKSGQTASPAALDNVTYSSMVMSGWTIALLMI